jgi:hypothetical protein
MQQQAYLGFTCRNAITNTLTDQYDAIKNDDIETSARETSADACNFVAVLYGRNSYALYVRLNNNTQNTHTGQNADAESSSAFPRPFQPRLGTWGRNRHAHLFVTTTQMKAPSAHQESSRIFRRLHVKLKAFFPDRYDVLQHVGQQDGSQKPAHSTQCVMRNR